MSPLEHGSAGQSSAISLEAPVMGAPGDLINVPAELQGLPQWVTWRLEERNGRPTKVPYGPHTGYGASVTNPTTWASFDEAVGILRAASPGYYGGIGFVFSGVDPYFGVDLDKCRDAETGEVKSWALDIVRRLDSYTELSPSGTGIHIIARGRLSTPGWKAPYQDGKIEVYDRSRFFTVTGHLLEVRP